MNKTLKWALVGACLPGILGCRLTAPAQRPPQPVSSAAYTEGVDCSGLSGIEQPEETVAPQFQSQTRIPYGYRWDDYQGSDIEHDVFGDRQRVGSLRAITHPHLISEVACKLKTLFAAPGHRSCSVSSCATSPTTAQSANQTCEMPLIPPVPVPLTIVPPAPDVEPPAVEPPSVDPPTPKQPLADAAAPEVQSPDDPAPMEPTPAEPEPPVRSDVPPRNIVPRPLPKSSSAPSTILPETPGIGLEQTPESTPSEASEPSVPPKPSARLIPTLILPAAPPAPVPATTPDSQKTEALRKELRRNKIPANSSLKSTEE